MSSEALIDILMENVSLRYPGVSYKCRSFKGLGGFTQKNTVKETPTGKLLNDLSTYLRGFNNSLKYLPDSAVFIVLDNDDNDPAVFRAGLEEVAKDNHITIDYVFCLAVEEMEAWLLGDREALQQAYPAAKMQKKTTSKIASAAHGKCSRISSTQRESSNSRKTSRRIWKLVRKRVNGRNKLGDIWSRNGISPRVSRAFGKS